MVNRRRSRIVVFRLDREEYALLVHAQTLSKARNVTDYCRSAVLHRIDMQIEAAALESEDRKAAADAANTIGGCV